MAFLERRPKRFAQSVHPQTLHDRRARHKPGFPGSHMGVRRQIQEFRSFVELFAAHDPRHHSHVGNSVLVPAQELLVCEVQVQHVELALGFHREAVNGVLDLHGRVLVEVAEPTPDVRGRRCLPEQPVVALAAGARVGGDEGVVLCFGHMLQDVAGLKHLKNEIGQKGNRKIRLAKVDDEIKAFTKKVLRKVF